MNKRQEVLEQRGEPHSEADAAHQAALLIDFDNVTMGIRSNLGQELRNLLNSDMIRGKVAVQRAYADWRRYPQYIVPLSEASIDLIFAPAYGSSKKNATDIRLAIDALELVFIRPEIRTFILMSGDSDFSSLVLKLKEYGKYVIGVGIQESSSDLLVQNCDEYYSYSALSGLSKEGEQPTERHDPWVLVEKAIEKMVSRGDTMRSDRLKQVMLEIDPSFSEKEQGFSKFNRFVVEAASRGLISIQKMENGQYGVAPPGKSAGSGKGARAEREQKEEKKGRRNGGRRGKERDRKDRTQEKTRSERRKPDKEDTRRARPKLTMKSALELLDQVLDQLLDDRDDEVRDSDVKRRLLEIRPNFDEGELGYSKFSKFLQAAEEKKAVRLTRGPSGNYHVKRPSAGGTEAAAPVEKRAGKQTERQKPEAAKPGRAEEESQTTVQRLARFLFGGKKEDREAAERAIAREEPKGERAKKPQRDTEEKPAAVGSTTRPGGEARAKTTGERRSRKDERSREERSRKERSHKERSREGGGTGQRVAERERRERPGPTSGERREQERAPREESSRPQTEERREQKQEPVKSEAERSQEEGARAEPSATSVPERSERAAVQGKQAPSDRIADAAKETAERPKGGEGEKKGEPAVTPAPMPGSPRGTIRGRWGSRGRYRPAEAPPPIFEGQRSPKATPKEEDAGTSGDGSGIDIGHTHIVEHLKTHYSGVGEKTAETLVENFGADLFRIMDEQPDRIRAVLPDHRADRVLEARRQERQAEKR